MLFVEELVLVVVVGGVEVDMATATAFVGDSFWGDGVATIVFDRIEAERQIRQ
jgi:hypothetical protein